MRDQLAIWSAGYKIGEGAATIHPKLPSRFVPVCHIIHHCISVQLASYKILPDTYVDNLSINCQHNNIIAKKPAELRKNLQASRRNIIEAQVRVTHHLPPVHLENPPYQDRQNNRY
jgi:hypothetical protein